MTNYNPYLPVDIFINDKPTNGRPYKFSAEINDHNSFLDATGKLIVPTELSTVCPDCGQGLSLEISLDEPPFPVIAFNCTFCRPPLAPMPDPFVNPLAEKRVASYFVDTTIPPNAGNLSTNEIQQILNSEHTAKPPKKPIKKQIKKSDKKLTPAQTKTSKPVSPPPLAPMPVLTPTETKPTVAPVTKPTPVQEPDTGPVEVVSPSKAVKTIDIEELKTQTPTKVEPIKTAPTPAQPKVEQIPAVVQTTKQDTDRPSPEPRLESVPKTKSSEPLDESNSDLDDLLAELSDDPKKSNEFDDSDITEP